MAFQTTTGVRDVVMFSRLRSAWPWPIPASRSSNSNVSVVDDSHFAYEGGPGAWNRVRGALELPLRMPA